MPPFPFWGMPYYPLSRTPQPPQARQSPNTKSKQRQVTVWRRNPTQTLSLTTCSPCWWWDRLSAVKRILLGIS